MSNPWVHCWTDPVSPLHQPTFPRLLLALVLGKRPFRPAALADRRGAAYFVPHLDEVWDQALSAPSPGYPGEA